MLALIFKVLGRVYTLQVNLLKKLLRVPDLLLQGFQHLLERLSISRRDFLVSLVREGFEESLLFGDGVGNTHLSALDAFIEVILLQS